MHKKFVSLPAIAVLLALAVSACSAPVENEQLSDEQLAMRADELSERADTLVEQRLGEIEDSAPGVVGATLATPLLSPDRDAQ